MKRLKAKVEPLFTYVTVENGRGQTAQIGVLPLVDRMQLHGELKLSFRALNEPKKKKKTELRYRLQA